MRVKREILWTVMVLVSFLMGISLGTSDWVVCDDLTPDEYMDLSIGTDQDEQQSIFQYIHLIGARSVGVNAPLPLWGPMSRPAQTATTRPLDTALSRLHVPSGPQASSHGSTLHWLFSLYFSPRMLLQYGLSSILRKDFTLFGTAPNGHPAHLSLDIAFLIRSIKPKGSI